jgi:hypothetical protein
MMFTIPLLGTKSSFSWWRIPRYRWGGGRKWEAGGGADARSDAHRRRWYMMSQSSPSEADTGRVQKHVVLALIYGSCTRCSLLKTLPPSRVEAILNPTGPNGRRFAEQWHSTLRLIATGFQLVTHLYVDTRVSKARMTWWKKANTD